MNRNRSVRWAMLGALLALLALAPPASAQSLPQRESPLHHPSYIERAYARGETIEFSLSWLKVVGGEARMTIAPVDEHRLRIHSLAESNAFFSKFFRVRDEIESIVSRPGFSTLRFVKKLEERSRTKHEVTVIDPVRNIARRKEKEVAVPTPVYDPLSLIFYLRTRKLVPGSVETFTVIADGKVYSVDADVVRREIVTTDAGEFRCVLVEPKMHGGGIFRDEDNRLFLWFSDDERHIPVRIRSELAAGAITASLKRYALKNEK